MRDKWVASGRRNSGNGLKVVRASSQGWKSGYSRGEGGGRLSRNLEHTLRTLNTFYGCGTLFLSLSLSLACSLASSFSLSLSNIHHDFFPFLDSPSWQTTRSRVLAHDNFILTCFLVWCVDTKVGLKVSTRRLCNWIIVSLLKKKYSMKNHFI